MISAFAMSRSTAEKTASVAATNGEMSTFEFRRDHAHRSTNGRVRAPLIAASNTSSLPCRIVASVIRSTNKPHACA
jgi:hypothetical protein